MFAMVALPREETLQASRKASNLCGATVRLTSRMLPACTRLLKGASYVYLDIGISKRWPLVDRTGRSREDALISELKWLLSTALLPAFQQFSDVANVTYPALYQQFLDAIDVVNFDLGWLMSAGCVVDFDFHDHLLVSTIGPIIVLGVLGMTYTAALYRNRGSDEAIAKVNRKHVSAVLLVTFLVYSSVSSTVFRMFVCDDLDDGSRYLRADYRIQCDSAKHQALQVYAGIMVFFYPVGIPLLYGVLLHKSREVLRDGSRRVADPRAKTISALWEPYTPKRYYNEVIECFRRMLLTGAVVFIYPNTAAQIAVTLLMAFVFLVLAEVLDPFASAWDCWVSRCGHIVIFASMYVALLLKVDVSDEREGSQKIFAGILVLSNVALFGAALAEMVWMWCAFKQQEDALPRSKHSRGVENFGGLAPVENS